MSNMTIPNVTLVDTLVHLSLVMGLAAIMSGCI